MLKLAGLFAVGGALLVLLGVSRMRGGGPCTLGEAVMGLMIAGLGGVAVLFGLSELWWERRGRRRRNGERDPRDPG